MPAGELSGKLVGMLSEADLRASQPADDGEQRALAGTGRSGQHHQLADALAFTRMDGQDLAVYRSFDPRPGELGARGDQFGLVDLDVPLRFVERRF